MAVFFLSKSNSPVMFISKFVNFLTLDQCKQFNWKKKVKTGYAIYFTEFKANFFWDEFFIGGNLAINVLKL